MGTSSPGPECQHCGARVEWRHRPADASWPAFAHVDTGMVTCAASAEAEARGDAHACQLAQALGRHKATCRHCERTHRRALLALRGQVRARAAEYRRDMEEDGGFTLEAMALRAIRRVIFTTLRSRARMGDTLEVL